MSTSVGFVSVSLPKHVIEYILSLYDDSQVKVVGSRLTEDGYDLILEGESDEMVSSVIRFLEAIVYERMGDA
jgi:hypothetical protein